MRRRLLPLLAAISFLGTVTALAQPGKKPFQPQVAPASKEGEQAIARFQVDSAFRIDLFAAEPLLANPVAFCIDEKGRFYVAETFRLHEGVTDIRRHMSWLDDDLACRTVADRAAMLERKLGDKIGTYARAHDRVRLIVDADGDGKADRSTVFADGFAQVPDGIAAGLLAREGTVWLTCIPDLWQFRDTDGDGKADVRRSLSTGYGVHVGYLGHDLHGLIFGPDGKIYFSIGDRGINVKTPRGRLVHPDTGCVLRCNPDGSDLEVFATGLRNPQELAFDDHGNLFTVDNNSDGGDRARLVHLVQGGDSGWRIGYQFGSVLGDRGPWKAEKLWQPLPDNQAAYLLPPLVNVSDGPSGLVHYPGLGLPERYRGHFFLADFRGGSANSGIRSFGVEPRGASFQMVDQHQFVWHTLATDVDFGPDGAMYFSDWTEGWDKPGKGRIYRLSDPKRMRSTGVLEVKKLFAEGFAGRPPEELANLIGHDHQRVRLWAQLALAERGADAVPHFRAAARSGKSLVARLHGIWGLGQLLAKNPDAARDLVALLEDEAPEVRGQAARVLGDSRAASASGRLTALLADPEPRVRFQAAQALGRIGCPEAIPAVLAMLRDSQDADPYLRHAGVMALAGGGNVSALLGHAADPSPSARLGVLLALRRLESPEIGRFLNDADPRLILEAARAINDVPIEPALPALASLLRRGGLDPLAAYRALNAAFRLGSADHARLVARVAVRPDVPLPVRLEAVRMLGDWAKPAGRDRVVGLWRSLPARDQGIAVEAFEQVVGELFTGPEGVRQEAVKVAARLGIKQVGPLLFQLVQDGARSPRTRSDALRALASLKDARLEEAVGLALADGEAGLRAEARTLRASSRPEAAYPLLGEALRSGEVIERQAALAALGALKVPGVDDLLSAQLDLLLAGKLPPELELELLQAAGLRSDPRVREQLARHLAAREKGDATARYHDALHGGDPKAGRLVFFTKNAVSCLRCHKVGGEGGEVGPDLTGIADRQKRAYLLEAIVDPNKQVAKGFETVVLVLGSGKTLTGILKDENETHVTLMSPEGQLLQVARAQIDERFPGKSSMPEDLVKQLSRAEIRDLVAFLASLKK